MRRRGILSTPLQLLDNPTPQSSKYAYFNYMKEIQTELRFQLLQHPKPLIPLDDPAKVNLPNLRDIYYKAREDYLLPEAKKRVPAFLQQETDKNSFSFRELDGFSRRFELLPQRLQLEYSLLAYLTKKECFLESMPKDREALETNIYQVQKLERLLMARFDAEVDIVEKNGGKIADINLEILLDRVIKENVLKELRKDARDVEESSQDTLTSSQVISILPGEIDAVLIELMKYITISQFNTDFYSKHHQRWRMDAFRRMEDLINEEKV